MNSNDPNSFKPRSSRSKKRKVNKDGLLALIFIALIAIIIIVIIIFLVKAITSGNVKPTESSTTTAETTEQTSATSQTEPEATTAQTGVTPLGYNKITLTRADVYTGSLIVVDKTHIYRKEANTDNKIVSLYNQPGFKESYRLKNAKTGLREDIILSFASMLGKLKSTFPASLGSDYLLIQGAATVNDPDAVINYGDENESGLSFDLRVYIVSTGKNRRLNADEEAWLAEHCAEYGFIIRYPADKEYATGVAADMFHLRYVGRDHALYMVKNNLCLEEYIDLIKHYDYTSPLYIGNGKSVYYVASEGATTTVYIKGGSLYTKSGNNIDGYIITIS